MRGWLEHDRGRVELSHAGPDSVIARGDVPAFEAGFLVSSVEGRERRRPVRVPAATPAGERCRIEDPVAAHAPTG